jgi:5-methylcytosine-specific restriction endonuclease McrA
MRWEFYLFIITSFLIANTYYDNKLTSYFKFNTKYIKMAMYGFIALTIYVFLKKHPSESRSMLVHANDLIKYLPIDKGTTDFISPILDFTSKRHHERSSSSSSSSLRDRDRDRFYRQERTINNYQYNPSFNSNSNFNSNSMDSRNISGQIQLQQPTISTKRSVSETKKKYVASRQNWKCAHCSQQLDYTYEVDHVVDLQYGGSNEVDNLVALCRNCHGKKTMKSRL